MACCPAWAAPRALYVHVPFCRSKCTYCDFYSLPCGQGQPAELAAGYVEGVLADLDRALARLVPEGSRPFDTVYVGGGTPSVLPPAELSRLLSGIATRIGDCAEWTMEANPESLSNEVLDIAETAGVNRLSLGIQSLDDDVLALLGRPARRDASIAALERAKGRGHFRLSADFMSGLPGSHRLASDLALVCSLGLEHVSVYDLVLEEGTPLAMQEGAGVFELPAEDEAAAGRAGAEAVLARHGLRRYEVSNFSRPGAECLHNLAYWHMESYLGIGPGAVSTFQAVADPGLAPGVRGQALRVEEAKDLRLFAHGRKLAACETLIEPRDSAVEMLMMAMRTVFGLEPGAFRGRFGIDPKELLKPSLGRWAASLVEGRPWPSPYGRGLAEAGLALAPDKLDILNRFLVDCLEDIDGRFPERSH